MKIALLGYGKMGKLVETIALREGWEVGPKLDIQDNADGCGITPDSMAGVDVAIEFSQPGAVLANIEASARARISMVIGTTGWAMDHLVSMEHELLELALAILAGVLIDWHG